MSFGIDKCAKCTMKRGRKVEADNIRLENGQELRELEGGETYKYLGVEESEVMEHQKMREKVRAEYEWRVKRICKTELTPKNKIVAINQLAVPVLTYSFGVIDWPQSAINAIDIKTRKILTLHKIIYRNQCLPRIYLPRGQGGLGLTEINQLHRATTISTAQYIKSSASRNASLISSHQNKLSPSTSIFKLAENFLGERLEERCEGADGQATKTARETRGRFMKKQQKEMKDEWRENLRAGYYLRELEKDYIDVEGSLLFLKNGALPFDGERLVVAAQDLGLPTGAFKKMAGLASSDRCRFCKTELESVGHLVSGCQTLLADGHYTERHNRICKYLHYYICKHFNIHVATNIWEHEPPPIDGNDQVVIYYDKIIPTASFIQNSAIKPDIVIWDKSNQTGQIIDVSVPNDAGLNRAEREKITKYQQLKWDIKRNWRLREVDVIPVIVGATGLMKKNLNSYLQQIPGKPKPSEVQISALKGTIAVLKRMLGCAVI